MRGCQGIGWNRASQSQVRHKFESLIVLQIAGVERTMQTVQREIAFSDLDVQHVRLRKMPNPR
jgi:hypothetical protein